MGTLKKSLFVFAIFFAITNYCFSQNNSQDVTLSDLAQEQSLLENSNQNQQVADDYFLQDTSENQIEFNQPNAFWTFFKMIFFLLLVCVALYFVMRFFKNRSNDTKSDDEFLRRVSTLNLGPGKAVEVVTLIDNAYILGVTDSNISVIDKIEDKELIEALNLNFDKKQNVKKPMNFSDMLDIFMPNGPRNKNIFEDEEKKITNLSKKSKNQDNV